MADDTNGSRVGIDACRLGLAKPEIVPPDMLRVTLVGLEDATVVIKLNHGQWCHWYKGGSISSCALLGHRGRIAHEWQSVAWVDDLNTTLPKDSPWPCA